MPKRRYGRLITNLRNRTASRQAEAFYDCFLQRPEHLVGALPFIISQWREIRDVPIIDWQELVGDTNA